MSQNSFSLLEGLRPFAKYLSISQQPVQQEEIVVNKDQTMKSRSDEMISDWGFDMDNTNSPTLVNIDLNNNKNFHYGIHSDDDLTISSMPKFILPSSNLSIQLLLKNIFNKFNDIDLSFQKFQDEFKYILITSQLLDETILISKYKKKISTLQLNHNSNTLITKFGNFFINSGSNLLMNDNLNSLTYIHLVSFIRHLFKNYTKLNKLQSKSLLIIISVNLFILSNYKLICYKIIEITILNNLKKFIKNYQRFDISIIKLLNKYKELTIFPNMLPNNIPSRSSDILKSDKIYEILNNSVNLLTSNILNNINQLFSSINSSDLENYCGIYNIDLNELNYYLSNEFISNNLSNYEKLLINLKKFQYLRRFLICCLLSSTNEININYSEFLNKVIKIFQADKMIPNSINLFNKLNLISSSLQNIQNLSHLLNLNIMEFIKFEKISTSNTEDSLKNINTTSSNLSNKLKEVQLNLSILDKHKSIDNQIEDFNKIGELINSINQIYNQDLSNLQNSVEKTSNKPFNLVQNNSVSPLTSSSSITLSKRKRFSLPPQQHLTPQSRSTPRNNTNSISPSTPNSNSSTPKNYKRLSTGLSISLLTVMENESDIFDVTNHKKVSYDDNYINITPKLQSPAYLSNESEQVESKKNYYITKNNLLSNENSVIINKIEEDDDSLNELDSNILDNIEFKKRLEKNFNRVLSSSTVIGNTTVDTEEDNFEINYNNSKIDEIQGGLLINELKSKINSNVYN